MKRFTRCGAALLLGTALSLSAVAMPAGAAKPTKPTKPGAPTITAIAAGVKSVRVFFTKPADNGGSKIVNYRVVCKSTDGGRKGANEGTKSPIKVSGLNVKTYTCTVAARNKVGLGTPSAPSEPFVPKPTPKK